MHLIKIEILSQKKKTNGVLRSNLIEITELHISKLLVLERVGFHVRKYKEENQDKILQLEERYLRICISFICIYLLFNAYNVV